MQIPRRKEKAITQSSMDAGNQEERLDTNKQQLSLQ